MQIETRRGTTVIDFEQQVKSVYPDAVVYRSLQENLWFVKSSAVRELGAGTSRGTAWKDAFYTILNKVGEEEA